MWVTDCGIRNPAERSHLLPRFVIWLVKMWCFRFDAFRPSFSLHMQLRNMRQTCARQRQVYRRLSAKQQASVPFSVQVRTFHSQLLILIVNFLQYYQKEINLEHENNCSEEVLPNSRPQLSDQQSSERNPLSNRMQSVAKIQKSETCLRIHKPMATAKRKIPV